MLGSSIRSRYFALFNCLLGEPSKRQPLPENFRRHGIRTQRLFGLPEHWLESAILTANSEIGELGFRFAEPAAHRPNRQAIGRASEAVDSAFMETITSENESELRVPQIDFAASLVAPTER
jgi:hypothetical protein